MNYPKYLTIKNLGILLMLGNFLNIFYWQSWLVGVLVGVPFLVISSLLIGNFFSKDESLYVKFIVGFYLFYLLNHGYLSSLSIRDRIRFSLG